VALAIGPIAIAIAKLHTKDGKIWTYKTKNLHSFQLAFEIHDF
jgi:hypothetical protein